MKGTGLKILSRTALLAVMLVTSMAVAQNLQSRPIDLAVTYYALHTNHITAQSSWMKGGGAVELGAQMYRGLGIAARVEGDHAGPTPPWPSPSAW